MLNLGRIRLEARRLLDGEGDNFWADKELNDWANDACNLMLAISQAFEQVYRFSTVVGQQEYPMPTVVGLLKPPIKLYNNTQRDLTQTDQDLAQDGSGTRACPYEFYVRWLTGKTVNEQTDGSLTIANVDTTNPSASRMVVGLNPVPDAVYPITVPYYARHFTMRSDLDVPTIPPEHHDGIVAYVVSKGKAKEQAFAESDRFKQVFNEHATKLRDRNISKGIAGKFPRAKTDEDERSGYFGEMTVYEAT